jgi:hypothetical protein
MKTVAKLFIIILIFFTTSLRASIKESNWISPWETFEEAFPQNLSLVRRISIEESWNRGFEELEKYSLLHKEWTFENDRLLFEKMQMILAKYSAEISLERVPQLKLYFQNRIKRYSSALPDNVVRSYYFYLDFFPEDKRIANLFQESFLKMNSDTAFSNDSETDLLLYMIRDLISQNKQIPLSYFKMLFNYCESFSVQSKTKQEALILLNALFESKEEQLSHISIQEWDNLLTKRLALFKSYRKNKLGDQVSASLSSKANDNLYIHSIIMQNKLFDYQTLQNGLNWNLPEIQKFIEHAQSSLRSQFSNSKPRETYQILFSQIEILRTLLDLKTSLDGPATSNVIAKGKWENGKLRKNQEEKWYQKLKDFHSQAIGILQLTQYSTSLIFQCYQQKLDTKTCQTFREYLPFQHSVSSGSSSIGTVSSSSISTGTINTNPSSGSGSASTNAAVTSASTGPSEISEWTLNEPYIYFPPGRFEFDPNSKISIKAERIDFHPLAFIYAPSGTVTVETLEIDSPWIDVSGREEIQIPHLISRGKRPWIKDSSHCHIRHYIDGATLVSIPKKRCGDKITKSESCGTKLEWTLFTIKNPYPNVPVCASNAIDADKNLVGDISKMIDLGIPPEEPTGKNSINEPNGSKGGTISLSVQDQFLNPLLLAQGANGISGLNGQSSPLCNDDNEFASYKVVVSQSQDEYAKWIEAIKTNPYIRVTPLQSEIYHHVGLLEIFLPRTSGSNGGSGGEGGQIKLNIPMRFSKNPWKMKSFFVSGGIEGLGGNAGICGPNTATNGKMGVRGANGQPMVNKNSLVYRNNPIKSQN